MNFGILAAGEGSRLAGEGVRASKPLVLLDGMTMIERLIRILERHGADSISVVVNEKTPEVESFLRKLRLRDGVVLNVIPCDTPTAMHSFGRLSPFLKGGGRFVVATVDTVFDEKEFGKYLAAFENMPDSEDGMMAVTDFIDDEKPLYVETDRELNINGFLDTEKNGCDMVSGGVYGLKDSALDVLDDCLKSSEGGLRDYQRALLTSGLRLKAFPMGKIIDVDHAGDVAEAEKFLTEEKK